MPLHLGSQRQPHHLVPLLETVCSDLAVLPGWEKMAGAHVVVHGIEGFQNRSVCSADVNR